MIKKIFLVLTKRERVVFLAATAIFVVSGGALLGIRFIESTRTVPAAGGEYVEGFLGQPAYVNPVIASTEADRGLVRLVFSNVTDLALTVEPSDDGRTWKVRLKENLRWQDNEKLTSDDVIFTVQKIQDGATASPLQNAWQGVAAQRLSELEVQFSLINSYAFFRDTLKNLYILPKHLFADVPPSNWRLSDYNLKPVGSGPYAFSAYEKRPDGFIYSYKLVSAETYFGEKPLIERFTFQFFPKRADAIKNFNSGQIDALAGLASDELAEIKRPYETFGFRLPDYYAVFFNQNKNISLKDPAVRAALREVVDRAQLVTAVLGGHGKAALGPIPEGTPYFNGDLLADQASSSLEIAGPTLDAAGWKMNADGFREKTVNKSVIPLEFTLVVPQIGFLTKTAELLRNVWQKIGVKVNLDAALPEEITRATIKNRDYEALIFGSVLNKNFDLFSFWHSSERFYPGLNLALYNNKRADTLIEAIRQNADEDKRAEQVRELQKIIADDAPALFLYSPDYLYVASKNLRGLEAGLIGEPSERFISANKWYLKTTRVLK